MRFAIFGNTFQSTKSTAVMQVLDVLQRHNAEIFIDHEFCKFLIDKCQLPVDGVRFFDGNDFVADFAISVGGDGTLLRTAARVASKNIPVIGVNTGRLGFLAGVTVDTIEKSMDSLFYGGYSIHNHTTIQIETIVDGTVMPFKKSDDMNSVALNDIAVLKRDNAAMISIETYINDEYIMTYQADGLVVTTPTGSTAYSLSNGGPIIAPATGILCLTPVAPHSLNVRPIVVNDDSEIKLKVVSRSHNFLVAVDGNSASLDDGTTVLIRKASCPVRIVRFPEHRYFATLREKMMWGVDQR